MKAAPKKAARRGRPPKAAAKKKTGRRGRPAKAGGKKKAGKRGRPGKSAGPAKGRGRPKKTPGGGKSLADIATEVLAKAGKAMTVDDLAKGVEKAGYASKNTAQILRMTAGRGKKIKKGEGELIALA